MAALAGLAAWLAAQGDHQRAVTLAQLVIDHRASTHDTRQRATAIQAAVTPLLTAADLAAIQRRLPTMSFDAVVTELLTYINR